MSSEAWRNLRDDRNSRGEPLMPFEPSEYDDLWESLTVEQQQVVARGVITLEELVETITSAADAELCPRCCCRPVKPMSRFGLCETCHRAALNEALQAKLANVELQKTANVLKTRIRRERIAGNLPRPRTPRIVATVDAAGRSWEPSDSPVHDTCSACSAPFVPHAADERECLPCRERRERREAVRTSDR